MHKTIMLALDVMGGDHGAPVLLEGVHLHAKKFPNVRYLLCGDEKNILPLFKKFPNLEARCEIRHTTAFVSNTDKPSAAVRMKDTSMRLAIEAVANGEAAGVVSAGNTGAYMALSKLILRTIPGVERPAIAAIIPCADKRGQCVMLDLGANSENTPLQLAQFAVMGSIFAHNVFDRERPSVGLLNIGTEEMKGNALLQEAASLLRDASSSLFEFIGYVEGDDITKGKSDVVVTDGFTGNISLKSAEGIAKYILSSTKEALMSSLWGRIGALLAAPALGKVKARFNPSRYNGAMFLGLRGVSIKSHGSADAEGIEHALAVAERMASHDFYHQIADELQALKLTRESPKEKLES